MPRDYAQKPQPRQQRRQSRVPRWVWVLTLLVACGFVGGLYLLSQQPEPGSRADASGQSQVLSDVQSLLQSGGRSGDSQSGGGEAADEESASESLTRRAQLEFYTLLEQTDVFVPDEIVALRQQEVLDDAEEGDVAEGDGGDADAASQPAGRFIIQVASFRSAEDADNLRARLILEGLTSAHITRADLGDQGLYHRVMVGPVQSRTDTERVAERLDALGLQGLVRNHSGD